MATDTSYIGKRITMIDGTKDRIAKATKSSYKTKGGSTIKAANVAVRGRGLIEVDGGGATRRTAKAKAAETSSTDEKPLRRSEAVSILVDAEIFETKSEAKGIGVDELREMAAKALAKKSKKKAPKAAKEKAPKAKPETDISKMLRRDLVAALIKAGVFEDKADARGTKVNELREMLEEEQSKGKGKKAKAKAKPKAQAKESAKKAKTTEKERRAELIESLIAADVIESKREARGIGIDVLREMLEDSQEKPAKKTKVKRSRGAKEQPAKTPVKLKPVQEISEKLARSVEKTVNAKIGDFIRQATGYDFTVACVGGVFNEERLTVQIGLLGTDASADDIEAYASDMTEAEAEATGNEAADSGAVVSLTSLTQALAMFGAEDVLSAKRLQKAVEEWLENFEAVIEPMLGDEVSPGTMLEYGEDQSMVVGFSDAKQKVVLIVKDEDDDFATKLVDLKKVVRMEIIDDDEAEPEEDQDPDLDDLEDDLDAELDEDSEDDLESDEDEEDAEEDFEEEDDDEEEADDEEEDFDDEDGLEDDEEFDDSDEDEEEFDDSDEDEEDAEEDEEDLDELSTSELRKLVVERKLLSRKAAKKVKKRDDLIDLLEQDAEEEDDEDSEEEFDDLDDFDDDL